MRYAQVTTRAYACKHQDGPVSKGRKTTTYHAASQRLDFETPNYLFLAPAYRMPLATVILKRAPILTQQG